MDSNIEFLNYIYQNAEMGKNTISQLISIVEDGAFKQNLESQLKEYKSIFDISNSKIEESKKESKGISTFSEFKTYIMINISTMTNKTPSHIAEMLIQGSTMGIVDVTKNLKKYKDSDGNIIKLAERLLKFEQENVDEMKKFL